MIAEFADLKMDNSRGRSKLRNSFNRLETA
jgi:hypothetical protein